MRSTSIAHQLFVSLAMASVLTSVVASLSGCASSHGPGFQRGSEPDVSAGNAHPAAYEVDSFRIQKWQARRPASRSEFFFKKCSVLDGKTYWSKTSYECSRF